MNDIRRNSITGIFEHKGLIGVNLHFSEWWNGEGMDFDFDKESKFGLHIEELHALFVAAIASGMVDVDEAINDAAGLNELSKERAEARSAFRQRFDF